MVAAWAVRVTCVLGLSTAVLASLTVFAGAQAGTVDLDGVAEAPRSDPVFVDDDAERAIDPDAAEELRSIISDAGIPVYIAILSDATDRLAGGDAAELASVLAESVGRPGTYGVVVGERFRAGSSELLDGQAGELAAAAVTDDGDDTLAVLTAFVESVGQAVSSRSSAASGATAVSGVTASSDGDDGGDGGSSFGLPAVLVGAAALGGLVWWRRRERQRAERKREEEADRQLLKAEISVLASDVVELEPEVLLHPGARTDFDAAVNRFRAAEAAIDSADEALDLVRVARVVTEARYSMDRVRAIVAGREPPEPPAELQRPGRHGEPAVGLDDSRQPVYMGGYPGGYGGGWFGGAGSGMFSGLLLGSMLAGGFGGWGYGGTTIINENGDGSDGGDGGGDGGDGGGDFGGGDFGGGDFGGGGFGGE